MSTSRPFWLGLGYGLLAALAATGILLALTRRPAGIPVVLAELPTAVPVRVYVLGAVAAPGVYPLPAGSILRDALQAAGGATTGADLTGLNLAAEVTDGSRVDVPLRAPTPTATRPGDRPPPTAMPDRTPSATGSVAGLINLNTASAAELDRLPRIGPAMAERIIAGRPYTRIEDILRVRGIGPATFQQIKGLITVE
jgi:competence protein ComEA